MKKQTKSILCDGETDERETFQVLGERETP